MDIISIDNINDYYDTSLKEARLDWIAAHENAARFEFIKIDIAHRDPMESLFEQHKFDRVIHLAAQAGVRFSIENPHAYIDANIVGFMNILDGCRHHEVQHLIYASSS